MLAIYFAIVVYCWICGIDTTIILSRDTTDITFAGNGRKYRIRKIGKFSTSSITAYHTAYIVAAVNLTGITAAVDCTGIIASQATGIFVIMLLTLSISISKIS